VRAALVIQHAEHMRRIVRLYSIFPHYLINDTIFEKKKRKKEKKKKKKKERKKKKRKKSYCT